MCATFCSGLGTQRREANQYEQANWIAFLLFCRKLIPSIIRSFSEFSAHFLRISKALRNYESRIFLTTFIFGFIVFRVFHLSSVVVVFFFFENVVNCISTIVNLDITLTAAVLALLLPCLCMQNGV
jgi:hypothetical protein